MADQYNFRNRDKDDNEQERTVNMTVILHNFAVALKHLFWIPLILVVLLAGFQFLRNRNPGRYTYTCRAVLAVSSNYDSATDILSYNFYYDSTASKQLSATFPYVLSSDAMKMLICQKLGVDAIPGSIQASSITNAGLFVLTVTCYSPEDALTVINAVIDSYPQAATAVLGDTQLSIIDEPVLPSQPNEHYSIVLPVVEGGLLGLGLGLLFLFLLSLTRKTIHAASDLRSLTNLPCLAYLPLVGRKARSNGKQRGVTILNEHISEDYVESIRALRLKLSRLCTEEGCQVVMVTSTLASEGKSTVSSNLALSLATEGKRVVLVDADLRKQSLKQVLGVTEPSEGLVELLSKKSNKFRLLPVPDSNLLLLSGDVSEDHPQRLLDSKRMTNLIEALRGQMDYVILDTPPAGLLSDAATLSKYADKCLYVVRQDNASTTQIYDSIQALVAADVNLVGCVLNGTKEGTTQFGYGNKYSHDYGYGNRYGSKYATNYGSSTKK